MLWEIPIKMIWQEGSHADMKRYKNQTDYFRIMAKNPKGVQFFHDQTKSTLIIGGLSPIGRVKAIL